MLLALLLVSYGCLADSQPHNPNILIQVPSTLLDSSPSSDFSCPAQSTSDIIEKELRKTRDIINRNYRIRPCKCGGPGWTRVLYLNMADNRTCCPANWTFHEEPVRGCGRKTDDRRTCDSVLIPVTMNYSVVCGRIYAYQRGYSWAFYYSVDYRPNTSIDSPYVSGLSLTHGLVGQRKHVWTFACAYDETSRHYNNNTLLHPSSCPCINPALTWPYEVPSFVGDSYFCDTGAHTYNDADDYIGGDRDKVFMDDPLWEGEGCGGSSTCCSFSSPPWFCQQLKYHTSDGLELRLCLFEHGYFEDKLVSLVEIYVK